MPVKTLESEQNRLIYRVLPESMAAHVLLAAAVVTFQSGLIAPAIRFGWLAALLATVAAAGVMLLRFRQQQADPRQADQPRWLQRSRALSVATGLVWGAGGVLLYPAGDPGHQLLLVFALACLSVGGITTLAIDTFSTYAFVLFAAVPPLVRMALEPGEVPRTLVALAAIFMPYVLVSGVRMGRRLRELAQLRGEAREREDALLATAAALRAAKEQAVEANRAKSEFLASMSHELRTPLNAVLGFSRLLAEEPEIPEESRAQAGEIEHAGQHLLSLVSDLIDLARIEANRLDLFIDTVSVKAAVASSLAIVTPLAREKGVALAPGPALPDATTVRADHGRLRQSLINFLSNAIKYNLPAGSVTIAGELRGERVRLSITDTGAGIPAELQGRIFHAFDRLGRERGQIEGTGIGLVITKRMVEAMGGSVGFVSAPGRGSTFWLELPAGAPLELPAPAAPTAAPQKRAAPAPGGPRLLLAEDNPLNQRLAVAALSQGGYSVDVVSTGKAAVEAAQKGRYALILMDCQMPEMDGVDATIAIRAAEKASGRHLPIIALTAEAMKGDRERCLAAGMDDVLVKPYSIARLRGIVADHARHLASNPEQRVTSHPVLRVTSGPALPALGGPPQLEPALLHLGQVNVARVDQLFSGDRGFAVLMAADVAELLPALREQISSSLKADAGPEAAVRIHRLRGSVSFFVSIDAVEALGGLEEHARRGRLAAARAEWLKLEPRVGLLNADLRTFAASGLTAQP